jgi:type II secretory pathway component GspD/PulD (secretin)
MPNHHLSRILAVSALLTGAAVMAEAPAGFEAGQTVIRTPEDIEAGKRNVVSVAEQLRALFAPTVKVRKEKTGEDPFYLKVVPSMDGRSSLVYQCRYNTAEKLFRSLDPLISNNGQVEATKEQNMLVISDNTENINALAKLLPLIDIASSQVLIEAKVVEVMISDGMQRNLSMSFSQPGNETVVKNGQEVQQKTMNSTGMTTQQLGPSATKSGGAMDWVFAAGDSNIKASIQWLQNAKDAKVLSAPTIVVARNEKSVISNGQDIPIQSLTNTSGSIQFNTTFKRVGVTLTVTPKMINPDNVTIEVIPEVSNIQGYQTITQGESSYSVPVISVRSIKTNVKLDDGQIIVMGGLYSNRESVQQERIPFLSDMPFFGEFFTSKYREKELIQLLFFLRVKILTPDDLADGILFDPDMVAKSSNDIGEIIRKSDSLPPVEDTLNQVKHEFIDRDMMLHTDESQVPTATDPIPNPNRQ